MNKKFSTLAASLLLASAFSAMAAPSSIAVSDLKAGDIVRLKFNNGGDKFIGVEKSGLTPTTAITYNGGVKDPYTTYFNKQNAQLWKVAKVTKTSTGDKTFQFVNKLTGEYLALDLATNAEGHKTKDPVKLNPAGNREWAFAGNGMYAYSSSKDSIFYLDGDMYLHSAETAGSALQVTLDNTELPYELPVDGFNKLMALTGHNAMLNFNNSKDVTSTQTNILKNTKWTAVGEDGTDKILYLTNGETTDGAKLVGEKWSEVEKKMYLQVDTAYYDETTPNYFRFDVDTLNNEVGVDETYTHIKKHPNELGQFAATYYFNNDSIAISAKYLPKKAVTPGPSGAAATFEGVTGGDLAAQKAAVVNAFADAMDNISKSVGVDAACASLKTAVEHFAPENDKKFSDAVATNATLISDLETALSAPGEFAWTNELTAYKEQVNKLAYRKAGYTENGSSWGACSPATTLVANYATLTDLASKKVYAALVEWIPASKSSSCKFETSRFVLTNDGSGNWTAEYKEDGTGEEIGAYISQIGTEGTIITTSEQAVLRKLAYRTAGYSIDGFASEPKATVAALPWENLSAVTYFPEAVDELAAYLKVAYNMYVVKTESVTTSLKFGNVEFDDEANIVTDGGEAAGVKVSSLERANETIADEKVTALVTILKNLNYKAATSAGASTTAPYFWTKESGVGITDGSASYPVVLRSLADVTVLTVDADGEKGYILPLIQPYATSGGDATDIATAAKVYNLQIQNVAKNYTPLRANKLTGTYLVAKSKTEAAQVDDVDASNVYAQWAFIPGTAGYYSIVNRAIPELVYYTGPVSKVKDADNKVVADTYVLGTDTLKIAGVTLNEDNFYTEKVGNKNVQYDYSGAYYTGKTDGIYQTFEINPVSPFMSQLAAQLGKDSVLVLGDAEDALIWKLVEAKSETYGLEIDGLPQLKKKLYRICTTIGDDTYVIRADATTHQMELTKSDSYADAKHTRFELRNVAEGQYNFIANTENAGGTVTENKMTINATPAKPILEVSGLDTEKNDLFAMNKSQVTKYRKLTAEDGVLGNAKIYMENEPNRYLYENTANIVANNGNKIAKDSLNFLGIYNTAAMEKNAALFVDTAYVEREGVYMPQYMFALGVTDVPAHEAIACTYEHNHFDNAGNKVDAEHCSHATPATLGYKAGRYLVALTDSIEGVSKHPGRYDGETRLAFVEAIHRNAEDSLIIKNSKYTDNSKQIVKGEAKTYASNDTLKIEDNKTKAMTFALEIADQSTQSFYLATSGDKYVRILNGVPVLTGKKDDAAVFNIEATDENATANEAIAAEGVQVIGGKGAVTVQGAAGKVITVANVLGQTIANQVAASDNVTIAAPAGIVVVAVEGEATKVVVK